MSSLPRWLAQLLPILLLLGAIGVVLARLPQVELGHSAAFKRRRFWNWFPLGLCYAFLYFARYNINEATSALGALADKAAFGTIFAIGAWVYFLSFWVNGPLTDRLGGRITMLVAVLGAAASNLLMGALVWAVRSMGFSPPGGLVLWLSLLFGLNMYFQSFGAVSIVKVNAAWFHVRERGVQGGVFGILISLGIYFGYDWSRMVAEHAPVQWVFIAPALCLLTLAGVGAALIRDAPSDAGHVDFDLEDASSSPPDPSEGALQVFARMFRSRIILTLVAIEFCTGFLRNGVMSWYPKFARAVGSSGDFVATNWGILLCISGIIGGMFAGVISDRLFQSRRGPVAFVLYLGITLGAMTMTATLTQSWVGWVLVLMALNYVGVHGMLSGAASADFGGKRNAGVVTGIIDGFVYFGTGLQSLVVGQILPSGGAERSAANWIYWPLVMLPVAFLGLYLCTRVWRATPRGAPAGASSPEPTASPDVRLRAG